MCIVQSFRYTGIHSLSSTEGKVKYWDFHGDQSQVRESLEEKPGIFSPEM